MQQWDFFLRKSLVVIIIHHFATYIRIHFSLRDVIHILGTSDTTLAQQRKIEEAGRAYDSRHDAFGWGDWLPRRR